MPSFVGFAVNVPAAGDLVLLLFGLIFDTFIWLSSNKNSPQGSEDIHQSFSSQEQELQRLATQADECLTGFMFPLFTPSKFSYIAQVHLL